MSKGPGRVEGAILSAFRAAPDGAFSTAELADIAFGTDAPNKAQRVSILRAAKHAAKRLFDAKQANWKAIREDGAQAEMIFCNMANMKSYATSWFRRAHPGRSRSWLSPEEIERMVTEPDARYAEHMAKGGAWWAYVEQARLDMLGIDSGPERDAVAEAFARRDERLGMAAQRIRETTAGMAVSR